MESGYPSSPRARSHPAASPLLLEESPESEAEVGAHPLRPIPVDSPPFREDRLQSLLARHPESLPIDELEPSFAPLILLGREIPTPSGSLDLLYTSPEGHLTLVETKLWDNPEARREVVGQIIDYAKDLSRWSFEDLDKAVQSMQPEARGIVETVRQHEPELDEPVFIDNVTRGLKRGRFLLIVAGNGVREGVEELAGYLQRTPSLHFSLAMVELALYRLEPDQEWLVLLQPRTIARTVEIERAIVTVKAPEGIEVEVAVPSEGVASERRVRRKLSEETFYEELAESTSSQTAEAVRDLCVELEKIGLVPVWGSSSLSMRLPDPDESGDMITIVVIRTWGKFFLGWFDRPARKYGREPVTRYRDAVLELTGAELASGWDGTREHPVEDLAARQDDFVSIVRRFIEDIRVET